MLKQDALDEKKSSTKVDPGLFYGLKNDTREFETVFRAEFRLGNMFLATPKGAYDLAVLINHGEFIFPETIYKKVPEAVEDVRQASRCLAFELYTASGFHLHRANESVVLKYFDHVSKGKERPSNRNLGSYIKALENEGAGENITSCLRDLKDMHRNPLMHPDQSIEDVNDALALLSSIHNSVVAMLHEIPLPEAS